MLQPMIQPMVALIAGILIHQGQHIDVDGNRMSVRT